MERDWQDFKALYGNIEGARAGFEKGCETLLREYHKGMNVQQVAVSQGDGGIDVLVGHIGHPLLVYQCKFFLDKIGPAQKAQIKDSFKRVFTNPKIQIKQWTLCMPRVFTLEEHEWWAEWRRKEMEQYSLNENFITLFSGNQLIDLMKNLGVYNQVFRMEEALKLEEIYNWVKKNNFSDTAFRAEFQKESPAIVHAIHSSISSSYQVRPEQYALNNIEITFYQDVEIDYVTLKESVKNAYRAGASCADLNFTLANELNYTELKNNLKANLNLVKTDKSFDPKMLYELLDISFTTENAEKGLQRGIKEIVCHLYRPGKLDDYYFDDCLYWFAKIMRYGAISRLYAYQLTQGQISKYAKEYSWFFGRFITKEDYKKFYNETEATQFRACLNHDLYDYLKFYATKDYFSPMDEKLYYKYGLPQLMELRIATRREKIFWAYEDVTVYYE